jgi:glycosyltransferase involved in cell wall biosynthesis
MPERLVFLLGKDPATSHGGDMTMFRTMRAIASERYHTEVLCLSDQPDLVEPDVVRVPKPPISLPRLVVHSLARRRSLVHTRFDIDAFRAAIEESSTDRFVAEHSYMAEAYLRAEHTHASRELLVSTDVPESSVWRRTHRVTGRIEGRRLRRDELRVAGAARAVGGYDRAEMDDYRALGFNAHWLPITLPPAARIRIADTPPRLVLLGNRMWRPNADAAETIVRLWPEIARDIPDAELWLVGPKPGATARELPAGVTDLGFVDDIDGVLAGCRALAAPVAVGDGVRVKLLEAASRGLPVVATPEAVGSIEATLGMKAAADEHDFVSRCRTFLLDADVADDDGARLHAANARRWTDRVGHEAVFGWLSA